MSALNRGSFSFDAPNTTLSTIGSIEIKTNSTCGSFGAAFTNAPINIENSGAFIDFGSSDFVGLDAPNTFCIKAFNGGSFLALMMMDNQIIAREAMQTLFVIIATHLLLL